MLSIWQCNSRILIVLSTSISISMEANGKWECKYGLSAMVPAARAVSLALGRRAVEAIHL